jgi:cellulose synthase/poly-beta-1,6-N-acetylglucosamine synthase-like glycosyltransferase/endo-1,4-beta-D-glucanase Y
VNKRLPFRHLLSHSLDSRWTTALDFFASKSRTLSRIFSPQRPSLRKVLSLILTLGLTASLPSGLTSLTSIAELHASVDLEPRRGFRDSEIRQLDNLSALWSYYRHRYILDGRVVSWDEQAITTSEGQGYAMLRAVWSNDRPTFDRVWSWTKQNLQIRDDKLFAWKWKGKVLSRHSATDADQDIALALILASRRFDQPAYEREALAILTSIWELEILPVKSRFYVIAGDWAMYEDYPVIHVAYLAPYAYEVFAAVDPQHAWHQLIDSSYDLLRWIYDIKQLPVPPEILYLDKDREQILLTHPTKKEPAVFSYDAFPLFWRVALDAMWFGRRNGELRDKMLAFFVREWQQRGMFLDRYTLDGAPLSSYEGLPLYASVHTLARAQSHDLARLLSEIKLAPLHTKALAAKPLPYYLHNWLWFDRAVTLQQARHYDEFLGFLRPFDFIGFSSHVPWELFAITLILFLMARWHSILKLAFLLCAVALCVRYLHWRLFNTLNFMEGGGLFISLSLWCAELYAFSTVVLLAIQVGIAWRRAPRVLPSIPDGFAPSVDVLIPIYSESCEILEKTLIAAAAMDYPHKHLYVLDDSHRDDVARLASRFQATYIKGPRQHAKAGNLNHALAQTTGELIVVFDTDHIPVTTFLKETVPYFVDPKLGFVQTPHHFYNQDIFQRALSTSARIPNEQDLFNHAIQVGRDRWNGSFFVGSGAVFRRAALAELNGFNLMSITEDIHTSQHLHARGWTSVFVDKDLAIGLTAENLASHIIQRRRWMLGCLQIFFKDNPLVCRGLPFRHRLGYFASLYYFLFPIARVVFWITPLYFLLFHLHPILADVSILLAYLLPFILVLPMMSTALLPGWPRLLWSTVYESTICFPLFRSMFELFLPKRLGFKVTPKGLLSGRRSFDWRSSATLLLATALTLGAIGKGLWEFWYFGIEKDAYFFNLAWAMINAIGLVAGLFMAWEKPQRRKEERVPKALPFVLTANSFSRQETSHDISVTGLSFHETSFTPLPSLMEVSVKGRIPFTCQARVVYHEPLSRRRARCGLEFLHPNETQRRHMILNLFADPTTWQDAHANRARSSIVMAGHLLAGLFTSVKPDRIRRRRTPRQAACRLIEIRTEERSLTALVRDCSAQGIGVLVLGQAIPDADPWLITLNVDQRKACRLVYRKRLFPSIWRLGFHVTTSSHPSSTALAHESTLCKP